MGVLLISIGIGTVLGVLLGYLFGAVAGVLPGIAIFMVTYFFLSRRMNQVMEQGMMAVQKDLQRGQIENAVRHLEALKNQVGRMQLFASSTIDGQIGSIYFMRKEFDRARPYLEKSFVRLWHAQVMRAVLESKKKNWESVDQILERATKYSPKQGLLWSTWAYLHWKGGNRDKAISVLARGKDALGGKDEALNENLLALQNNKKMKMKRYGEAWYQFHLEQHPAMRQAQRGGNVRFARR